MEHWTMYQTTDLIDATILLARGYRLAQSRANGSALVAFDFEIEEAQATAILTSADASICRAYHRALREVRRQMDAVTGRARP
jgi:hypothetical protein